MSLFSLTAGTLATFALVDVAHFPSLAVWVPVTVVVMLVNYFGCKHWAFAPPRLGSEVR